ncbi:MAG: hypothetical protein A3K04_08185 [Gallionellales bacterium RBG_16_56_9]|nr:MAG: hypothetical protein A3K04_08185 [Gallionellales bacterium RBG_16_56_9]
MQSGHKGVFVRSGKFGRRGNPKLERIQELTGPSVPQMFFGTRVYRRLIEFVHEAMPKNLADAITHFQR